jgi:hypothetical protein
MSIEHPNSGSSDPLPFVPAPEELFALVAYWTRVILDPRFCGIPNAQLRQFAEERIGMIAERLDPYDVFRKMDETWVNCFADLNSREESALCTAATNALEGRAGVSTGWDAFYAAFLEDVVAACRRQRT